RPFGRDRRPPKDAIITTGSAVPSWGALPVLNASKPPEHHRRMETRAAGRRCLDSPSLVDRRAEPPSPGTPRRRAAHPPPLDDPAPALEKLHHAKSSRLPSLSAARRSSDSGSLRSSPQSCACSVDCFE
ncbi:unnamed protein product, partial [Urochloa humidicola]